MSNTEDHTYKNLKSLIKNENLCVLLEDKLSCAIIMNRPDYIQTLESVIDKHITKET